MSETAKKSKAILVVSFGTSYEATRKVTIEAIENTIAAAFPEYQVYRAWTSKMILAKLKRRDNLHIHNVREAMEQMKADGITEVIVQPTHVTNGIENDIMKKEVLSYAADFTSIKIGDPLLTTEEDKDAVIEALTEEFSDVAEDTAIVLMGHGAPHYANYVYAAINYAFQDKGNDRMIMGTVEAFPDVDAVIRSVGKTSYKKVLLAPFMIVAGDHANNDLAGDEDDSWKSLFEAQGYEVSARLKGLGEYAGIRAIFADHVKAAIEK